MPCYHPLQAYKTACGDVVFYESARVDVVRSLQLPCGQCVGCRLERSRQWATRCMHEASLYRNNMFITLTYNNKHLPADRSLNYDDFQRFMKRFRKHYKGIEERDGKRAIRFYMAGEYGEQYGRPHFHACIFNFSFDDKKVFKRTPSGSTIYTSEKLSALWPFGYASIGDVNFQSAAYVARYIMKKVNGQMAVSHYEYVTDDGEIVNRRPEFTKMSLKPGIGFQWFEQFKSDVYPHDYVVVNGRKVRPPRFYDQKFKLEHPEEFEVVEFEREKSRLRNWQDNTEARLRDKEQIAKARLSLLKRCL